MPRRKAPVLAVARRSKPLSGEPVPDGLRAIFGQQMADARRQMRLPLVALEKLTGISRGYLSLAERGAANVTLDVVMVIAKALGRDPSEMLTPKPKPPPRRGRSRP